MKYCSQCGSNDLITKIPNGDTHLRLTCNVCGAVHYQNPKIVTGCLVLSRTDEKRHDRVLLCQRAIEPRYGLWTFPAGFMENEETVEQSALRETWEEAGAKIQDLQLYAIFSIPRISQVYMLFRGYLDEQVQPAFQKGEESLAVQLFEEKEIPWDTLAFPIVRKTLNFYFADRQCGDFPIRVLTVD